MLQRLLHVFTPGNPPECAMLPGFIENMSHALRLSVAMHLIGWTTEQAAMPSWLTYQQQRQRTAQGRGLTFAQPMAGPAAAGNAGRGCASARAAGAGLGRAARAAGLRGGTRSGRAACWGAALTAVDSGSPHTPFASCSAAAHQRFADQHRIVLLSALPLLLLLCRHHGTCPVS